MRLSNTARELMVARFNRMYPVGTPVEYERDAVKRSGIVAGEARVDHMGVPRVDIEGDDRFFSAPLNFLKAMPVSHETCAVCGGTGRTGMNERPPVDRGACSRCGGSGRVAVPVKSEGA